MASEVDICNLALSHIGDSATVSSINPPEGSAQAEHCARFYPIARDTLLELHSWSFATKRTVLSQLTSSWSEWDYCYAKPSDLVNTLAILPPDSTDDNIVGINIAYQSAYPYPDMPGTIPVNVPREYSCEILGDGTEVIYTDQDDAVLRYTATIKDTTKFSPLFVITLSAHLASMIAGPIIKGDAGAAESKRCVQLMAAYLAQAKASDANEGSTKPQHIPGWIARR